MKRVLLFGLIFTLLAGCYPRQVETTSENIDKIATFVAATLTAAPATTTQPDQNEQPADSPAAPSNTPEPAANSPTPTPTITLTPTATLTPTLAPEDPVASLGVPSFRDNFADGSNFYLYDEAQSSYQVDDNQMVLVAKKANNYETWTLAWGELTNFYLEITGTSSEDCSGKARSRLIFRAPDTSEGYLISIACDGSYRLSKWEDADEKYTTIKNWTSSAHINTGPGSVNRLGIKAKNSKLTGFINGHQVFELNDSTFSKGRFGLLVAATDTPGFTAYLSQVVYWKLP